MQKRQQRQKKRPQKKQKRQTRERRSRLHSVSLDAEPDSLDLAKVSDMYSTHPWYPR